MRPKAVNDAAPLLGSILSDDVVSYLLVAADGEKSVEALIDGSPQPVDATLRTLLALVQIGAVNAGDSVLEGGKGIAPLTREECESRFVQAEGGNHYMVLGVAQDCDSNQVREAYYYLARRFHPDRFRSGPMQDLLGMIEGYFSRVTEAYNTLSDGVLRQQYDEQLAGSRPKDEEPKKDQAYLARENFARARLLMDRGQHREALQFIENALDLDRKPAYLVGLASIQARHPRQRSEAMEHLNEAIALDPTLADAHVALAELHLRNEDPAAAAEAISQALHWAPNNREAQRLAERLAKSRRKDEGGLRGLFKR